MGSNAVRDSAQLALAIYAESLAARRVVAILGDASSGLGALFVELGARTVHVLDPDASRARLEAEQVPRGVVVRPLGNDPVPLRAVDLVVVPDLGLFDDPAVILELAALMASETGVALVAATNRDAAPDGGSSRAFDYYELFDLVAREFECVRMIAELPFEGVALAEFGQGADEAPAVSVDTQLADENRPPDAFVALASQRDVSLDPYSIVQLLPSTPVMQRVESRDVGAVGELEAALDDQRRQLARLSSELEEGREAAEAGRIAVLQVEEIARRADLAERSVAALEEELASRANAADEHARLEEALRERAQAVQSLEAELVRRDRMVRELVETLDEAAAAVAAPSATAVDGRQEDLEEIARLRDRLDVLSLDLARREADAQAAGWSIAELERRLAQAAQPSNDPGLERQLAGALDELDALRRALVQEHEARLKAESGDELARARAEIQRQSVLLEQMARDLESRRERGEEHRDSR
jgi:hypothetical protein